ncbi:EamA family transporter [filamentous cyanobacterium CCP5]|nr:EamA family transporter [filamentous cyanobacterium CCP5]
MTLPSSIPSHSGKPPVWVLSIVLSIGLLAYASGAIFVRLAIQYDNADGLGFCLFLAASRMLVAALCCLPAWRGFRGANYAKRDLTYSAIAGIFLALYFATWMTSLSFTSIAASTTLVNLNPLWVILLSWLWLRHSPTGGTLFGAGLAIVGAVLISAGTAAAAATGTSMALGNGLALAGSGAIAAYILFGHVAQKAHLQLTHHMAMMYTTAAIVLLPMPLLLKVSYFGHATPTYGCILLMALVTQLLGHSCINWSVKWMSPTLLSVSLLSEPLVASGLGYLAFRELPTLGVIQGGCIVMVGVAIAILCKEPRFFHQLRGDGLQRIGITGQRPVGGRGKQGRAAIAKPLPLSQQGRLKPTVAYRSRAAYLADQERMGDF